MSTVLEQALSILDSAPETPADLPTWFAERQRSAWQRFLETPSPKRNDETWRFSSIKQLDFSGYLANAEVPEETGNLIERPDQRMAMGLESRRRYLQYFTEDRMVERLSAAFKGVLYN